MIRVYVYASFIETNIFCSYVVKLLISSLEMITLYLLSFISLFISFVINRKKTLQALKVGTKKLWKISPPFVLILILISIILYLVPQNMIIGYFGEENEVSGIFMALFFGSITIMPGPIVYPLCKILLKQGVSYGVIAAFSTSLMMVGVLTYPMEKKYFGTKFAIVRNLVSLVIAVIISIFFTLFHKVLL